MKIDLVVKNKSDGKLFLDVNMNFLEIKKWELKLLLKGYVLQVHNVGESYVSYKFKVKK